MPFDKYEANMCNKDEGKAGIFQYPIIESANDRRFHTEYQTYFLAYYIFVFHPENAFGSYRHPIGK